MTLAAHAEGDTRLVITRRFAAPPARVFAALTDTAQMRRWMFNPRGALLSLDGEARVGGSHRFTWDTAGGPMEMTMTYEALEPPGLIRHREAWPQFPQMEGVVETRLDPAPGGGTQMRMTITYPSAEARAAALDTGMTDGMAETYANLDALLAA